MSTMAQSPRVANVADLKEAGPGVLTRMPAYDSIDPSTSIVIDNGKKQAPIHHA